MSLQPSNTLRCSSFSIHSNYSEKLNWDSHFNLLYYSSLHFTASITFPLVIFSALQPGSPIRSATPTVAVCMRPTHLNLLIKGAPTLRQLYYTVLQFVMLHETPADLTVLCMTWPWQSKAKISSVSPNVVVGTNSIHNRETHGEMDVCEMYVVDQKGVGCVWCVSASRGHRLVHYEPA